MELTKLNTSYYEILIIILFSLNCFSQSVADPRIRVSCTPNLLLTTSWQTINFNGSESLDTNTFGMDPVSGNRIFNTIPQRLYLTITVR
jgi:hypothetical protein